MKILFLDDNPTRTEKFIREIPWADCVFCAQDCIDYLKDNENLTALFLDHDLGGKVYVEENEKNTGSEVVRYLIDNPKKIEWIIIHTLNFPASLNMESKLQQFNYDVIKIPFTELLFHPFVKKLQNMKINQ